MLFRKEFHDRIAGGEVTVTFRVWSKPKAVTGGHYEIVPIGTIAVDSLKKVSIGSISLPDARASGFSSVAELVAYLCKTSKRILSPTSQIFRVAFHHERSHRSNPLKPHHLDRAKLDRTLNTYDTRSPHGPWTHETLSLIGRSPGTSSAVLAQILKRERAELKVDIRKLKKIGLVRSLEVGYRITPLGRSVIRET